MNLIDRLIPHLIFAAAMLPTLLLVAAAAVSLASSDFSLVLPAPVQAAVSCEPCWPKLPAE